MDRDGWDALIRRATALRRVRVGKEPAPEPGALAVDAGRVLRRRLRATHLDRRLPAGNHATAAHGGLQDSAPRAALLALHARLDGVDPGGWEHPSLAQIWFRWADYVVPRAALAPFTLGTLPHDAEARRAVEELTRTALDVFDALGGEPMPARRLAEAIPHLPSPHLLKMLPSTARIHIRWDASRIDVLPAEPPADDPDDARVELARRFLRWLGPAGPGHLARWAGILPDEAGTIWHALAERHDLVPVAVGGRGRWLLAEDEAALRDDEPLECARLLPLGDPVLYLDKDLVVPPVPDHLAQRQPSGDVTRRLLNSLTGRVVLDGAVVASWGRAGGKVTLAPWHDLPDEQAARIEAEALSFAGPRPRRQPAVASVRAAAARVATWWPRRR